MGKVLLEMSMSVDGYVTGPDVGLEERDSDESTSTRTSVSTNVLHAEAVPYCGRPVGR